MDTTDDIKIPVDSGSMCHNCGKKLSKFWPHITWRDGSKFCDNDCEWNYSSESACDPNRCG